MGLKGTVYGYPYLTTINIVAVWDIPAAILLS